MEVISNSHLAYGDSLFSTCLMQNMDDLRRSRILTDITLVVEQLEISAHKVILAAASPYFQAMLCSDMKESSSSRINMPTMEYEILEDIVNFFYTAQIKIDEGNVHAVMELADFLQVSTLRQACSHFLCAGLLPNNCLSTCVRAAMRGYPDLEHAAFRFALRNFSAVAAQPEFAQVPVDTLLRLLDSRLLNVPDEGHLLQSVIVWLKTDLAARLPHLEQLLDRLDLSAVSMETLIAVKTDPALADSALPARMSAAVSSALAERYDSSVAWTSLYKRPARKQRYSKEQEVLLAIGGESVGMAMGSVECLTLGYDKWKCVIPTALGGEQDTRVVPTMKHARINAVAVSTDYHVFVLGGRSSSLLLLSSVEEYSVASNTWRECQPLPVSLESAGAALLGKRILLVGGVGTNGVQAGGWALDPAGGVHAWKALPAMSRGRASAGVTALAGSLFVFGGVGDDGVYLSCAEKFDPMVGRWHRLAPMREPRARMACVAIDHFVYLLGGHDGTFWLKSAERYNTLTNEWCSLAPMAGARSDFSATVCDRRIYCLGGFDSLRPLNSVEKYNPRTDRWHCVSSMRHHRFGLCAATLHVPLTSPSPI